MTDIVRKLRGLFQEAEGLPPLGRNGVGQMEGWPATVRESLLDTISSIAHSSREQLCDAILEIERASDLRLPEGLLAMLARVAWDAPASPDAVRVSFAVQRGLSLPEALHRADADLPLPVEGDDDSIRCRTDCGKGTKA